MSGDGREANSRWRSVSVVPALKLFSTLESLTPIVFKGTGGYLVTGPESRQVYCFSSNDPEQMIDSRDVEPLLSTGLFRMRC